MIMVSYPCSSCRQKIPARRALRWRRIPSRREEDIIVSAIGEGKDWVGLYTADEPVDGSVQSVYWYYAAEHSSINIKEATKNAGRDALYDIPAGSYKFVLYANDSYEVLATKEFTVVSATAFEDTASFELAGGRVPRLHLTVRTGFAFRYNIGADRRPKAVGSHSMATYSAPCQQVTHAVYQWKGSYAASVAGTPLFSVVVKDHPDNGPVNVEIPDTLNLTGDLLFVTTCDAADGGITYWQGAEVKTEGVTFFDNGNECPAFCIGMETAKALPDVDTAPKYVLDFSKYSADVATDFGFQNATALEYDAVTNSGYITFKATGGDPYDPDHGQEGSV